MKGGVKIVDLISCHIAVFPKFGCEFVDMDILLGDYPVQLFFLCIVSPLVLAYLLLSLFYEGFHLWVVLLEI